MKTRAALLVFFLIAVGLAAGAFFLPKNDCGDDPYAHLESVISNAEAGDLDSIRALFFYSKSIDADAMEEYWALKGAKLGDAQLFSAYASLFLSSFSEDKKRLVLSHLKEKKNYNDCLVRSLEAGSSVMKCE